MKKAIISARVSSVNDCQNTQRQVEDLTRFASQNEYELAGVYQEYINGANKNENRMAQMECLDYCVSNKVDFLLLSELSRLGRSTLKVLKSLEVLHEAGVSVYIQNLDIYTLQSDGTVNPIVSIMVTMPAKMSAIERFNIAYRLNYGRANYIANGGKSDC